MNLVALLSAFPSTAFYSEELVPSYVRLIAQVNPVSAGADIFRHILLGASVEPLRLAVFGLSTVAGMYMMLKNRGRHLKG